MKLTRFKAAQLNHIEKLTLNFDKKLSFITGINGSGKTSVLTAIIALLAPSPEALASLSFQDISLDFDFESSKQTVGARKNVDGQIELWVKGIEQTLSFRLYDEDADFGANSEEGSVGYYRNVLIQHLDNKALAFLETVPTPMYLGLDRMYQGFNTRRRSRMRAPRLPSKRKRNIFGSSLGDGLKQAAILAEEVYSESQSRRVQLNREFVRDLLLSLMYVPDQPGMGSIAVPDEKSRQVVHQAMREIANFPRVEGISAEDVRSRIQPALEKIRATLELIPDGWKLDNYSTKDKNNNKIFNAVIQWSSSQETISRIQKLSTLISEYNTQLSLINKTILGYLELVVSFLGKGGKEVGFDARGYLNVQYNGNNFGVEDLSSGEAQIFVILTHLLFNPAALEAGVFIIDEPELSLHILWQEILVSSLISANPSIQYILATHSPSIILDREENANDLSAFSLKK